MVKDAPLARSHTTEWATASGVPRAPQRLKAHDSSGDLGVAAFDQAAALGHRQDDHGRRHRIEVHALSACSSAAALVRPTTPCLLAFKDRHARVEGRVRGAMPAGKGRLKSRPPAAI